jgi:hypothetical protein
MYGVAVPVRAKELELSNPRPAMEVLTEIGEWEAVTLIATVIKKMNALTINFFATNEMPMG